LGLEFDLNSKEVWEFDLKVNDDDLRGSVLISMMWRNKGGIPHEISRMRHDGAQRHNILGGGWVHGGNAMLCSQNMER
jgi:hypothetical protein